MQKQSAALADAKKAIRQAGFYFFCDKLKSGGYSVKLHDGNYEPIADDDMPLQLVGELVALATKTKKVPYTVWNRLSSQLPRVKVPGKFVTRYYF